MEKKAVCLCINCAQKLENGWAFCPNCRWQLDSPVCPQCGRLIDVRWKFCPGCQRAVKMVSNEQRLVEETNVWLKAILDSDK